MLDPRSVANNVLARCGPFTTERAAVPGKYVGARQLAGSAGMDEDGQRQPPLLTGESGSASRLSSSRFEGGCQTSPVWGT